MAAANWLPHLFWNVEEIAKEYSHGTARTSFNLAARKRE